MRANPDSTRLGDRVPYYLIHYHGWADRFDEWVDESRILKYTEENQKIQESMLRESQARKKKAVAAAAAAAGGAAAASGAAGAAGSGAAGTTVAGASGFAASGKKSKKDRRAADASSSSGGAAYGSGGSSGAAGAGAAAMQAAVLADLPPALRRSLLDEYDLVTVKKFVRSRSLAVSRSCIILITRLHSLASYTYTYILYIATTTASQIPSCRHIALVSGVQAIAKVCLSLSLSLSLASTFTPSLNTTLTFQQASRTNICISA